MMGAIISEAPPAPTALAEIKAFLRIATSEEDALLAGLVRAAADTCEAFIGRALIVRAVQETLAASTAWTRLGAAPVAAIESMAALAANGTATALATGDYGIDIDAAGEGWVRLLRAVGEKRVQVAYRAGMAADPNGVPESLRHGVVRLAAHLYTYRAGPDPLSGPGAGANKPPAAVTALWRPWRRLRLK